MIENTQNESVIEKSIEQVEAENGLNFAIPDTNEAGQGAEYAPIYENDAAQTGLYGLLSLLPIGLNIAGLPRTAAVWNDANCRAVSVAFIPVFRKYAWGKRVITFLETGGGMEEIALVATLTPIALATWGEYSQEVANHKEAQQEKEREVMAAKNEPTN